MSSKNLHSKLIANPSFLCRSSAKVSRMSRRCHPCCDDRENKNKTFPMFSRVVFIKH